MTEASYIVFAHSDRDPGHLDIVRREAENVVDYLNDRILGHEFRFYDYGEVPFNGGAYGDDNQSEDLFVRYIINYLHNENQLLTWDNVVIAHDELWWGYGNDQVYIDGPYTAAGCAVCAYQHGPIFPWEVAGFTWHELGHGYGATHRHGDFDDTGVEYTNLTPMCWSYLHQPHDPLVQDASTTWEGTGTVPGVDIGPFLNGLPNHYYDWIDPHHVYDTYSWRTDARIRDWVDDNYPP